MNKIFFFLGFLLIFIFSLSAEAQCDTLRYKYPVFNSITEHKNVKYGEATVWNIPYNKTSLTMNIYTPNEDTLAYRPLMIWVHPGGFLLGQKELEDMTALCDSFARRGYVTATIDYRKGFNLTSEVSAERAVYRGVQDLRAAIRFLKENYQVYGIDTTYTFIGGSSAGAFSVLHTVYMNQEEAPSSIAAGTASPALGCLDCEGNEYVHNMDISGYVALWGALGDSSWVNANETIPGLLVHGTSDGTVPFAVGRPFGAPTMPKTHGSRCVSNSLTALGIPHTTYFVEGEGHEFHGTTNGDWVLPPTPYWDTIFNLINTHFSDILMKETAPILGNSSVCLNQEATYHLELPFGYSTCWEVVGGTVVEQIGNSITIRYNVEGEYVIKVKQFSEVGRYNGEETLVITVIPNPEINFSYIQNENDLSVKFTPEPIGFVNYVWSFGDGGSAGSMKPSHIYPEAGTYSVSLTVSTADGCVLEHTQEIIVYTPILSITTEEIQFTMSPNPVEGVLTIQWNQVFEGQVYCFDMQGRTVMSVPVFVQEEQIQLDMTHLSPGIYMISIPELGVNERVIVD